MRARLAFLFLAGLLAVAVAGCGSDDSDTDTAANQPAANGDAGGSTGGGGGGSEDAGSDGDGAGGDSGQGGEESDSAPSDESLAEEFEAPPGGDDSIQTFGDVAEGEEEEEIVDAMRSFMRSLATGDPEKVCAGLSEGNRKQLELFLKAKKEEGDCATVIGKFLEGSNEEAGRAARGTVYQVRVEDENAFVLFVPQGGQPSYFVMKREDEGWKSTSLAPGTPFDPIPPPSPQN